MKIFTSFFIIILCNYLCGCTAYSSGLITAAEYNSYHKIRKVSTTAGEMFEFNPAGGIYFFTEAALVGSVESQQVIISINDIVDFRTGVQNTKSIMNSIGKPVYEIVDKENRIISFGPAGAMIDLESKSIRGIGLNTDSLHIPLASIRFINLHSPDRILVDKLLSDTSIRISQVVRANNTTVIFDEPGACFLRTGRYVSGITTGNDLIIIPAEKILSLNTVREDNSMSKVYSFSVTVISILAGIFFVGWLVNRK